MKDKDKDWNELRVSLNNNYDFNETWDQAINLFNNRLDRYFFNPTGLIINQKNGKGEGFSVVAILCALIEMLAAFRDGKVYKDNFNENADPKYYYRGSKRLYITFLKKSKIFQNIFWTDDESNPPFDAGSFYSDVRCALLHEARTKNNWTINTVRGEEKSKNFIKLDGDKKKIFRTVLFYHIREHVKLYCHDLKEESQEGNKLRRFFGRKIDDLFEIEKDTNYDWWLQNSDDENL